MDSFAKMRAAGRLAAYILQYIEPHVRPGVSTNMLNQLCHDEIVRHNAIPAPLNYHGFPKSICTSVNDVVCHGIPSDEIILKDGDIINIDVTVILDGWHGDTSKTFAVGAVSSEAQKLIDVTYLSMMRAIDIVKPGVFLNKIGEVIESIAEKNHMSVVRDFCGHGIGREFHMDPHVLHFRSFRNGPKLKIGDFFTIEPMLNLGKHDVRILDDGWTAVTVDGRLSAQFEHTVGVTENGVEIFTVI